MALHYLIDGYNMLYALPNFPSGHWPAKRAALLAQLRRGAYHGRNRLTVVFDSREGAGRSAVEGGMPVVYTAGESADDWISRRVREASNPRICVVVTNDQGLRRMIRGTGAKSLSVSEFMGLRASKPTQEDGREMPDDITEELKKEWNL